MIDVKVSKSTLHLDPTNEPSNPTPESESTLRPSPPPIESGMQRPRRASHNPATGGLLGHVPLVEREGIDAAIQNAREAQTIWREWSPNQRAATLLQFRDALVEDMEAIATLISREQGKPLAEAIRRGH